MIDPGELDQHLAVETPHEAPDGAGGVIRTYVASAFVWAAIKPVSARLVTLGDASGVTVTHRIRLRAPFPIDTRHRLRLGDRLWTIVTVRAENSRCRVLLVEAFERRP